MSLHPQGRLRSLQLWKRGLTLALAASGLFLAPRAQAFCRTNSCDASRGEVCSVDENGCKTGGIPLFWPSSCATFSVQRDGSVANHISADEFEQVIANAFDTWMSVDCGSGEHPVFSVISKGEVTCHDVEYNKDQGNANIYMFRDDEWTASGPGTALALTTVWYDWTNGKIYDADVEVNGTQQDITDSDYEAGADLPSIITHESGHFLGLDHSNGSGATMRTFYSPGRDNLRVLAQDDIDGICAVYPPGRVAESNSCGPRHGYQSGCHHEQSGCSVATAPSPSRSGNGTPFAIAAFSLAAAIIVRRRRQA